jgi:gliding motility-associated-like protein
MTIKKILFILFLISPITLLSQSLKILSVPKANDADTLNFCIDSSIIFLARNSDSTELDENTFFEWNYGNGIKESGLNLDSVSNQYAVSGGYFVYLKAISPQNDTLYAKKFIRIAFRPNFSGTNSITEPYSICFDGQNNDIIQLDAHYEYPLWKQALVSERTESVEKEINLGKAYTSSIYFDAFEINHKIISAQTIDTIAILMEHSNAQDIEIQIMCPDGISISLKKNGTKKVFMGEPVDNEDLTTKKGETYWYYFTEKIPNFGTMSQEEQQYFYSYTDNADSSYINEPYYPSGSYLPETSFKQLIGCNLNGIWQLAVIDNNLENNGYIKSWKLIFDTIPPIKQFKNSNSKIQWQSSAFGHFLGDSLMASVTAEALKTNTFLNFKFITTDDYGCIADTTVYVEVQKADFSANPETGDAELDVSFSNNTNWENATYDWDFGDGESAINQAAPSHTYIDKGEFEVILKATSTQACVNYDTLVIIVTAPISKVEAPNVFTPNNDGNNDRFLITHEGLREAKVFIYSRWGEKVAELSNLSEIDQGWDGSIGNRGNKIVKPGLYYYTVIAEGKDDKKHRISGALHIFYGN